MNSGTKTDVCDKWCIGCEEYTDNLDNWGTNGVMLCEYCNEKYENKTGYCSLDCCLSGRCDQSC